MTQGEKISRIRRFRKMTMRELGNVIGLDESNSSVRLSQYENNLRKPKSDLLLRIARALHVPPERIAPVGDDPVACIVDYILWQDEESPDKFFHNLASLAEFLAQYSIQKSKLINKAISQDDFMEWKLQYRIHSYDNSGHGYSTSKEESIEQEVC